MRLFMSNTAIVTGATDTLAQFTGEPGQAYTFRAQAVDSAGNPGHWTQSSLVSIKNVTKYYHHGGSRVAMRRDGTVYYLHGDHLGSTSLTTDSSGNVISEARYYPFGSVGLSTPKMLTNPKNFVILVSNAIRLRKKEQCPSP